MDVSPAIPTPEYNEQVHRMLHALSEARVPFKELGYSEGVVSIRVGENTVRYQQDTGDWHYGSFVVTLNEAFDLLKAGAPKSSRPLIDRLREAVPGLEWRTSADEIRGRVNKDSKDLVAVHSYLYCWDLKQNEPHGVAMLRPSDDEVVRIVRDWYNKTHPAKSILERTKELIYEAVPGVVIRERRGMEGVYLECATADGGRWAVFNDDRLTLEQLEQVKEPMLESARKALVKPTNVPPQWVAKIRDLLNARTSSSWLGVLDGEWQVVSNKHGQRLEVTATDSTYRLTVKEDKGSASYSELRPEDLSDIAANICKMREDLGIPAEAQKLAQEMRDAGFEVDVWPASDKAAYATVRSRATGREAKLHYGSMVGWACDEGIGLTREQVSTRVRLALTKTEKTAEQEAAEKKAAENNKHREILAKLKKAAPIFFWRFSARDSYVAHDSSGIARATITMADGAWDFVHARSDNSTAITSVANPEAALPLVEEWARSFASAEHEAFERRAREATTQYLQNAGMSLTMTVPLTAKQRCDAMVDVLAEHGVESTIETIDDHCAVCVTDPSTGEVHKVICDPAGNWLMDGELVYGLVAATELKELAQRQAKKKGKRMDLERVKELAVNAAYLTAANKVTESMQTVIVAGLMRQLGTDDESVRLKLAAFFSSELGGALIAGSTGFALQVLPHEEDGRIERLAESLQTNGMAKAMGAAVDVLLQPMLGSVQEALKGLPEPPKVRATIDAPAAEEHEEPAHQGRKARAAR